MNRLKINFIYMFFQRIVLYVMPLFLTPYLSRVLGAEVMGEYAYNYTIVHFFYSFACVGLSIYAERSIAMVSHDRQETSKVFWNLYSVQLIISGTAVFLYVIYTVLMAKDRTAAVLFIFYALSAAIDIQWFYCGIERFDLNVIRNITVRIITFILIVYFVNEQEDLYKYVFIMSMGTLLSYIPLLKTLKKYIIWVKPSFSKVMLYFRAQFIFLIPVMAEGSYVMARETMLGKLPDMRQCAYYDNANQLLKIPIAIISALCGVLLPRITNMVVVGQKKKSEKYFKYSIYIIAFISSAMCFGVMGIAGEFVPLFYGNGFEDSTSVLLILMPSSLFCLIAYAIRTQVLLPNKKDGYYVFSICFGAFVNLLASCYLVPHYAAAGAALSALLTDTAVFLVQYMAVYKVFRIRTLVEILPFYFLGIMMFLIISSISFLQYSMFTVLLFKVGIGGVFYLVLSVVYYRMFLKKRIRSYKL